MQPADLLVPAVLGLIGSLHCVQMCGPIVLACSVVMESRSPRRRLLAQAAYNLGRIATYSALGAAAGTLGTGLNFIGRFGGMRNTAAVVAGSILLLAGAFALAGRRLPFLRTWGMPAGIGKLVRSSGVPQRFGLGLALGLLPCGLVYAALLKALESAGTAAGAITMAAFGAGTALPLLLIGTFSSVIGHRFRRHAVLVSGLAVCITGTLLIWRGLNAPPGSCCHH